MPRQCWCLVFVLRGSVLGWAIRFGFQVVGLDFVGMMPCAALRIGAWEDWQTSVTKLSLGDFCAAPQLLFPFLSCMEAYVAAISMYDSTSASP